MKKNAKYFIILLIFSIIVIGAFLSIKNNNGLLIVKDGEVLPKRICDNINDKNIVIHKTGCSACAIVIPILKEIESESNIKLEFYDLAVQEEKNELLNMSFMTNYIPALISECKVYMGARSKEEYINILKND